MKTKRAKLVAALSLFLFFIQSIGYSQVPIVERDALIALFDSTDGENWTTNTNWNTTEPVSTWYGVIVLGNHVGYLTLNSNNLNGSLPSEIGDLTFLINLMITQNPLLSGEIPIEISNLTNLSSIELVNNQLSGPIPNEIGDLAQLNHFRLNGNLISGPIPSELGALTQLTNLGLSSNLISGAIPSELGDLTQLTFLDLSSNLISGTIPSELGSLSNLISLNLGLNELTGEIPPSLGNLSELAYLNLYINQLSGNIPDEIWSLDSLISLGLGDNELEGSLPSTIGGMSNIEYLYLHSNQLTGTIPTELGSLVNLTALSLRNNQFTGTIPSELGDLLNLSELNLSHNQFEGTLPYELSYLSNLTGLYLNHNLFDSIPDFSGISSLENLYINQNKLEFDEMEPHIGVANFIYHQQAYVNGLPPITAAYGEELSFSLQVGGSANNYQWYKDGSPVDGQTSNMFYIESSDASNAGVYYLEITNTIATETILFSEMILVDIITGINDYSNDLTFNTYPNPVRDVLNIEMRIASQPSLRLTIFDLTGRVHFSDLLNSQEQVIDVSFLPSGLYTIQLQSKEGNWISKFVKSE